MNNHSSYQALDLSLQMARYAIRQFMATPTFRFVNVVHHLERILRIKITQDFCFPESQKARHYSTQWKIRQEPSIDET
jgi:hypothetical protein